MLAEIVDALEYEDTKKVYILDDKRTSIYLMLKHGEVVKEFQMEMISNGDVTEKEFMSFI